MNWIRIYVACTNYSVLFGVTQYENAHIQVKCEEKQEKILCQKYEAPRMEKVIRCTVVWESFPPNIFSFCKNTRRIQPFEWVVFGSVSQSQRKGTDRNGMGACLCIQEYGSACANPKSNYNRSIIKDKSTNFEYRKWYARFVLFLC